jgi:hypothetical protein
MFFFGPKTFPPSLLPDVEYSPTFYTTCVLVGRCAGGRQGECVGCDRLCAPTIDDLVAMSPMCVPTMHEEDMPSASDHRKAKCESRKPCDPEMAAVRGPEGVSRNINGQVHRGGLYGGLPRALVSS